MMKPITITRFNTKLLKKRIPTLIGLGVLIVGLIAGTIIFSQGTGVFAPRATPQTTPKDVQISNISDKGFTVSFFTDEKTAGFVKYGEKSNQLSNQASDERDQLHGTVGSYQAHYITVGGLKPSTHYYFVVGTAAHSSFDNQGTPFELKTAKRASAPPAAKTIYGSVVTAAGTPAKDTIVYVKLEGAGLLSSLVKNSGSWAVPLSNARMVDGSAYANISDKNILVVMAKGLGEKNVTTISSTVGEFQSGNTITLGKNQQELAAAPSPSVAIRATETNEASKSAQKKDGLPDTSTSPEKPITTPEPKITAPIVKEASEAGQLGKLLDTASASAAASAGAQVKTEVNLEAAADQVVDSTQPKLVGKAKPNVKVKVTIHSANAINTETTTDKQGDFSIDLAALSKQLAPGEHSVEYTYIDPDTGEEITKTQTFIVKDPNANQEQLAMADITPTPTLVTYGTEAPYSSTASESASPSATISPALASRSAVPDASATSLPKSGAVDTTLMLIFGGLFFILSGAWSFWIATELQSED